MFKAAEVYEGIALGKQAKADFLLAVGGGSVIDTAKAIAYGLAEPEKGGVTKQLKLELDYAKMIVNKQEDLTWLR